MVETASTRRLYAVYPPWESLASASPRPNFPTKDKLRVDVVDPIFSIAQASTIFMLKLHSHSKRSKFAPF